MEAHKFREMVFTVNPSKRLWMPHEKHQAQNSRSAQLWFLEDDIFFVVDRDTFSMALDLSRGAFPQEGSDVSTRMLEEEFGGWFPKGNAPLIVIRLK